MSTWAELRAEVRLELKDTGATAKWPDAELLVYCNDALREYSTYWPLLVITEVTTTGAGYPVPSGTIDVLAVEFDSGFYEELSMRPGTYRKVTRGWYREGDALYLLPSEAPATIRLHTTKLHTFVGTGTGKIAETAQLTVPESDLELIKLLVMFKATRRTSGSTAMLDRFKDQGRRDDNPVIPIMNEYLLSYQSLVNERLAGRTIQRWVPGRGR